MIGKWHVGDVPEFGPTKYGYDHFWGFAPGALDYFTHRVGEPNSEPGLWDGEIKTEEHGYLTDLIADKTINYIRDYSGRKQPFLLSVHFNAPHWPWEGPEDEAAALKGGLSSFEAGNLATYGAMVKEMDKAIGRILRELERNNFSKNTVVVFTSDNGGERFSDTWPFTGKKTELLEGGLRVPALVRWPGHIKAGSVSEQVCMSMDWMPTFVSMAGEKIDPAYPSDGMDLTAALTRGAAPVSRKVFWRYRANGQEAMRDGHMKWLKINDNQFLFDVVADPLERANLRRKQPEVFARMAADYAAWEATMLREDLVNYSITSRAINSPTTTLRRPVRAVAGPAGAQPKAPRRTRRNRRSRVARHHAGDNRGDVQTSLGRAISCDPVCDAVATGFEPGLLSTGARHSAGVRAQFLASRLVRRDVRIDQCFRQHSRGARHSPGG